MYNRVLICALYQTLPACDHCIRGSTHLGSTATSAGIPRYVASEVSTWVHILTCIFEPTVRKAASNTGSLARASPRICATIMPSISKALKDTQPDSGWPCGVMKVNDLSSAYSTITPVETRPPGVDESIA